MDLRYDGWHRSRYIYHTDMSAQDRGADDQAGSVLRCPQWLPLTGTGKEQEAHEEEVQEIAVGRLLKAPQFFLLLISAMLGAAIITALDPTLGPHLEDILGYGPGTIGIAFAVIAGVYAAFTPFAGYALVHISSHVLARQA